ncbi:hypothetical protein V496_06340 [Pseudogymnoascus sp. VKM F-4515 (FW-2607)]|nr:hypothetical protein V496_06340 [Pseudogymnoascus sp. VKM F-4515 (FW-2607)]
MSEQHNPNAAVGLEPNGHFSWDDSFASEAPPKGQSSHQGKKKYHCPCGSTMSRSDVLLRHIRKCQQARDTLESSGSTSRRPSRSKTACNECAASRLKCDSQNPCSGCRKKSLRCEYTRKGYSDPYKVFRIQAATPVVEHATEPQDHQPQNMNVESGSSILPTPPANTTSAMEQSGMVEFSGLDFNTPFEHTNVTPLSGYGSVSMNDAFLDLDWDSLLTNLDWPESVVSANNATTTASDFTDTSSIPKETAWNFTEGLQLRQIDSVEAKCIEIQSYIGAFQTGIDHTILSKYLTRDRLVDCVQLYAKCFQSIHPILHLPTFELTKTPPDLLAAMMLVGACYSSNVIPPAIIVQGAIHMLLVLECSTHERAMSAPPLASIQATALLCQLLILTQNPQAYYFATMHRARTISMAERAGLFYTSDAVSHWDSESSFDWMIWSQLEMRKRLAHHIFVDDIGGNIFTRSSSHISPFTFYVDTPCYNDCWVAPTANECLEKLRSAPPPIQVATAVKRLRSASSLQGHHLFDASDCGMLEIIVALHSVLFWAMEESLDDENNVPLDEATSSTQSADVNFSDLLNRDLLNYDIANIATKIVGKYGSAAIRRVDDALDAWLRNWNARRIRDIYDERHGAFTHPLNFWLLAKLFLVLHFFRNRYQGRVPGIGEDGQPERDSELHAFYNNNGAAQGRLAIQMQVIGWLSKLRKQREGSLLSGGSFLSEVLNMQ